jgi:cellulose synthase/poly-beta-1,6-N-acetylglucosamine synthase-like glycosyltransferase
LASKPFYNALDRTAQQAVADRLGSLQSGARPSRRPAQVQFGQYLLDNGALTATDLLRAQHLALLRSHDLFDCLVHLHPAQATTLAQHHADWLGLPYCPAPEAQADVSLLPRFDPQRCVQLGLLPLYQRDGKLHIVAADPARFDPALLRADLAIDRCRLHYAPRAAIHKALQRMQAPRLSLAASTRVHISESCRNWGLRPLRRTVMLTLIPVVLALAFVIWPQITFLCLALWACLTLVLASSMKILALLSYVTGQLQRHPPASNLLTTQGPSQRGPPLPRISVLVPLYKEPEVLPALLKRLGALDYPSGLLEVLILLEEEDQLTQSALSQLRLPDYLRTLVVPDGTPRTKPRAMNYALDFCRGDIIGIYDAEDAPEHDQLLKVAAAMQDAPEDLAGVQGVLDYYNPCQNWIARCFTIEYAGWFRVVLPGMRRLGFAIPLGGTTVFCRHDVLRRVGGWDAHNVTEDADLGIRLARHGYRVEMLDSTTYEEANCRPWPWVRQRSRWLKGYMATYLVHMRQPWQLLRQLGPWQFCGVQLHFVTALSQFFLAPILWSFWLLPFGGAHPLHGFVPWPVLQAVAVGFITVECMSLLIALTACTARRSLDLLTWVPTLHLYFPMAALAAYKALAELIFAPFYWDKTQHGLAPEEAEATSMPAPIPDG